MKHFIITGAKHAGKTTYALKLKDILDFNGISAGGFAALFNKCLSRLCLLLYAGMIL